MKITLYTILFLPFFVAFPICQVFGDELSPDLTDIMVMMSAKWYLLDLQSMDLTEIQKKKVVSCSDYEIRLEWEENSEKLPKEERILRGEKREKSRANREFLAKLFIWPSTKGHLTYSIHYKDRVLARSTIPDRTKELCSEENVPCNRLISYIREGSVLLFGDTLLRSIEGISYDDEFVGKRDGKIRRLVIKSNPRNGT